MMMLMGALQQHGYPGLKAQTITISPLLICTRFVHTTDWPVWHVANSSSSCRETRACLLRQRGCSMRLSCFTACPGTSARIVMC